MKSALCLGVFLIRELKLKRLDKQYYMEEINIYDDRLNALCLGDGAITTSCTSHMYPQGLALYV